MQKKVGAMSSLFTTIGDCSSNQYKTMALSGHPTAIDTRNFLDSLWDTYKEFADINLKKRDKKGQKDHRLLLSGGIKRLSASKCYCCLL